MQEEPFPQFGITKFATLLPIYLQRCATMCALNQIYSPCCLTNCPVPLPTHRMAQGSTCQPTECGVGGTRRPSTWESSTRMPHQTKTWHLLPATGSMKKKKKGLWATGAWGGAFFIYTPHPLCNRRHGNRSNKFLQTSVIHARPEVGLPIQQHPVLAKVPLNILPSPLCHSGNQRC